MVTFSRHARDRLLERYGVTLSAIELLAIGEALAADLEGVQPGDWHMDVRLPEMALKFRCVVAMPSGTVKTVQPASTMHSVKRRTRENRKASAVPPKHRGGKLNRGHKVRSEKLFEKLDERNG